MNKFEYIEIINYHFILNDVNDFLESEGMSRCKSWDDAHISLDRITIPKLKNFVLANLTNCRQLVFVFELSGPITASFNRANIASKIASITVNQFPNIISIREIQSFQGDSKICGFIETVAEVQNYSADGVIYGAKTNHSFYVPFEIDLSRNRHVTVRIVKLHPNKGEFKFWDDSAIFIRNIKFNIEGCANELFSFIEQNILLLNESLTRTNFSTAVRSLVAGGEVNAKLIEVDDPTGERSMKVSKVDTGQIFFDFTWLKNEIANSTKIGKVKWFYLTVPNVLPSNVKGLAALTIDCTEGIISTGKNQDFIQELDEIISRNN